MGCLSLGVGCSDDSDAGAKEGESCTVGKDCQQGLVCRDQVCVTPTTGSNNNSPDATTNNDGGGEGEVVTADDYYISYIRENKTASTKYLHVRSTADGTDYQLGDADHPCDRGCWLTEDMKYYAWAEIDPNAPQGLNLFAVEVENFELQGAGTQVATGVTSISAAGNGLTYNKGGTSYFLSLGAGGSEREIAMVGGGEDSLAGGWHVDPDADVAFAFTPTLDTLELKVGAFTSAALESVYTLNGVNYAGGAGSYYGSTMPTAVSPDGKLLAFVVNAPNDYQECETAADCSGPVKVCGANNFCSVIELTAHFLDLDNLATLGEECASDSDCGGVHQCYQPGGESVSECIPARVPVGLSDTPYQRAVPGDTPRSGCDLSADDPTYHYTKFDGPVSFDNSGNLYGVARRDCTSEGMVGDSDIIKINPRAKDFSVVWGNPDTGFDANLCWDEGNAMPDVTNCSPYILEALVSPDGNDIAFAATNPNVDREQFAQQNYDLWRVLRNGKDHDWIGDLTISESVENIAVHPAP
ncbi:hypothetical protein DN745_09815 [Bradymonas sediminis]|uniref:Uncharacterized protein n=2 Tax=Bradymonas sediminis TaxID=1548548 RepID=A0A2Z4FLR6_9DELT|nr:hypothetical protein DN745_09815 [Bradymonas sediminis]